MTEDELKAIDFRHCWYPHESKQNHQDTLDLIAEVRLQRHRADENQRRVEALERQALADAEVTRGLLELVDCATKFRIGQYVIYSGRDEQWCVWSMTGDTDMTFDKRDEAITCARDLAAKGKGDSYDKQ